MNKSIESSLKLIATYLAVCIIGLLVCGLVFMIYSLCTTMVIGQSSVAFSGQLFFSGILFFLPIVIIISGMFLLLSMIRHNTNNLSCYIVYAVLLIFSWLVLIPSACNNVLSVQSYKNISDIDLDMSSNYFINYGNDVFYFSKIDNDEGASGVLMDTGTEDVYTFEGAVLSDDYEEYFADNLVKSYVDTPFFLKYFVNYYKIFYQTLLDTAKKGYGAWLSFATLGLALISIVGVKGINKYPLLNALNIVYLTLIIISFNVLGYQTSFMTPMVKGANDFLSKIGSLGNLPNPFIFLCNIVITIFMTVMGVLKLVYDRDSYGEDYDSSLEEGAE